jgi:hypothetical protein
VVPLNRKKRSSGDRGSLISSGVAVHMYGDGYEIESNVLFLLFNATNINAYHSTIHMHGNIEFINPPIGVGFLSVIDESTKKQQIKNQSVTTNQ